MQGKNVTCLELWHHKFIYLTVDLFLRYSMAPKGCSLTIITCKIHGVHFNKRKRKVQLLLSWRRNKISKLMKQNLFFSRQVPHLFSGLNCTAVCSGHERDDNSLCMLEIHSDSSWKSEGTNPTSHLQILEGEGMVLKFPCLFDSWTPSPEEQQWLRPWEGKLWFSLLVHLLYPLPSKSFSINFLLLLYSLISSASINLLIIKDY